MRLKSGSFFVILSTNPERFGAISSSTGWKSSELIVELQMPKIVPTRSSVRPDFSSAAIVFWNVGGSGLLAIPSISARFSAIAAAGAGAGGGGGVVSATWAGAAVVAVVMFPSFVVVEVVQAVIAIVTARIRGFRSCFIAGPPAAAKPTTVILSREDGERWDGGWRMSDGRWQMADGGWRMADGGWQNPTLFAICHLPSCICHLPSIYCRRRLPRGAGPL